MSSAKQSRDIADRYQLREALAKRPVGRWFRAFDREVDVDVGLLLVNPELLPDEASQNRFMGAVVEMRGINHRHLLRLFDVGREGDSVYLTTQMSQPIKALYKAEGVLDYVNSVADGLDAVHRAGQTHGRLTPSDIGEVQKLIKVSGAGLYSDVPPTVAMRVWRGLSCFWAPEVVRGERATPAADVYSLAAIAVVLLSSGKTADPHRALDGLKKENRGVYDALAPAMSVTPDDRPASPSLLVNRLSNAIDEDEVDEQETTYFVKASLDELNKEGSGPKQPTVPARLGTSDGVVKVSSKSKERDDDRTVLDVYVPPEVAAAKAKSEMEAKAAKGGSKHSRIAALVGDAKKAKKADLERRANQAKAANLAKKAGTKKGALSPSHDRTVVDRTTLPKGAGGERKVPAIVSMGVPVGPALPRSRGKGKDRARRDEAGVPQRLPTNDETEKMSAQHLPPGGFPTAGKKLPPTIAASSWVAQATKPAIKTRAKERTSEAPKSPSPKSPSSKPSASKPNKPAPGKHPPASARPGEPAPRRDSAGSTGRPPQESRSGGSQRTRRASGRPDGASDADSTGRSGRTPAGAAPGQRPVQRPAVMQAVQEPPPVMSQPAPPPVQRARPAQQQLPPAQQPQQMIVSTQPIPGNTHQVPKQGSNLTWLYLVLAAVASATLAILVAMALFGD